jgi:hypothetical protein
MNTKKITANLDKIIHRNLTKQLKEDGRLLMPCMDVLMDYVAVTVIKFGYEKAIELLKGINNNELEK